MFVEVDVIMKGKEETLNKNMKTRTASTKHTLIETKQYYINLNKHLAI
jgi:hypothetical protein